MGNNVESPSVEIPASGEFSEKERLAAALLAGGKTHLDIQKTTGFSCGRSGI